MGVIIDQLHVDICLTDEARTMPSDEADRLIEVVDRIDLKNTVEGILYRAMPELKGRVYVETGR